MKRSTIIASAIMLAGAIGAGAGAAALTSDHRSDGWTTKQAAVLDIALTPMMATGQITTEQADCAKATIQNWHTFAEVNASFSAAKNAMADAFKACQS